MSWNCSAWMDLWQVKLASWPLKRYYWFYYASTIIFFIQDSFLCLFFWICRCFSVPVLAQLRQPFLWPLLLWSLLSCGLCPSSSLFGDARLQNFPFLFTLRCCVCRMLIIFMSHRWTLWLAADRGLCSLTHVQTSLLRFVAASFSSFSFLHIPFRQLNKDSWLLIRLWNKARRKSNIWHVMRNRKSTQLTQFYRKTKNDFHIYSGLDDWSNSVSSIK